MKTSLLTLLLVFAVLFRLSAQSVGNEQCDAAFLTTQISGSAQFGSGGNPTAEGWMQIMDPQNPTVVLHDSVNKQPVTGAISTLFFSKNGLAVGTDWPVRYVVGVDTGVVAYTATCTASTLWAPVAQPAVVVSPFQVSSTPLAIIVQFTVNPGGEATVHTQYGPSFTSRTADKLLTGNSDITVQDTLYIGTPSTTKQFRIFIVSADTLTYGFAYSSVGTGSTAAGTANAGYLRPASTTKTVHAGWSVIVPGTTLNPNTDVVWDSAGIALDTAGQLTTSTFDSTLYSFTGTPGKTYGVTQRINGVPGNSYTVTLTPLNVSVFTEDSIANIGFFNGTFYGKVITDSVPGFPGKVEYQVERNGQVVQPRTLISSNALGTLSLNVSSATQLPSGTSGFQFRFFVSNVSDTTEFLSSPFATLAIDTTSGNFLTLTSTKTTISGTYSVTVGNNTPNGNAVVTLKDNGVVAQSSPVFTTSVSSSNPFSFTVAPGRSFTVELSTYDQGGVPKLQQVLPIKSDTLDAHILRFDSVATGLTAATFHGYLDADSIIGYGSRISRELLLNGVVVQSSAVVSTNWLGDGPLNFTNTGLLANTNGYQYRVTMSHVTDTLVFVTPVFATDSVVNTTAIFTGVIPVITKTSVSGTFRVTAGNNTPMGYAYVDCREVSTGNVVATDPVDSTTTTKNSSYTFPGLQPGGSYNLELYAFDRDSVPVLQATRLVTLDALKQVDVQIDSVGSIGPETAIVYGKVIADTVQAWPTTVTITVRQNGAVVFTSTLSNVLGTFPFSVPLNNLSALTPTTVTVVANNVNNSDIASSFFNTGDYPAPPVLSVSTTTMSSDANYLRIPVNVVSALPVTIAVTVTVRGNNIPVANWSQVIMYSSVTAGNYILNLGRFDPNQEFDVLVEAWNHPSRPVNQTVTIHTQPGFAQNVNGWVTTIAGDTLPDFTFVVETGGWITDVSAVWWYPGGSYQPLDNFTLTSADTSVSFGFITPLGSGVTYVELQATTQRYGTVTMVLEYTAPPLPDPIDTTTTGIDEPVNFADVLITKPHSVELIGNGDYSLEIYDIQGKRLFSQETLQVGENPTFEAQIGSIYLFALCNKENGAILTKKVVFTSNW